MLLGIEQKKGSQENLDGRLTVYALIDIDQSELLSMNHPVASVIHNGLLVAQGNFQEQNNLRDFLQSEMGLSLEDGLEEIIGKLDGLESALDPDKLREKIQNMKEFEDFIPTPAKIVPFHSESEIYAQEGDVFFVGSFSHIGNANLSVNSFPILYQARYREQQIVRVRNEIESLVAQIEKGGATPKTQKISPATNVREKILKEYIPNMLYCRKEPKVLDAAKGKFIKFFSQNKFRSDVDAIVNLIEKTDEMSPKHFRLLELYAKKIEEIHRDNFTEAEKINRTIREISDELAN
ncbi:MAG: hypothetical protein GF350_15315 [Chitinivibrionales bacterium]|nr:hypothetical protein [Chitinivibrionales bacterium]